MLLDATAGCPGHRRITGIAVGICHACERYGKSGPQIDPAAVRDAAGEWACVERRFHGADCARIPTAGEPLVLGDDRAYSPQIEGAQ